MSMFVNGSGRNEQSLQRTFHRCFLPSFGSFGRAVSEEKILLNRPIRNKNCLWWPCLSTDRNEMSNLNRRPFIDASYQVSVHFVKRFQENIFYIGQSETTIACDGHVCKWTATKCAIFIEDLRQMLPNKFQFIWLRGFRRED